MHNVAVSVSLMPLSNVCLYRMFSCLCASLAYYCYTKTSDPPSFSSFNGARLLQLAVQSSAVNIVHRGKLKVLFSVEFRLFIYSRIVNRFGSCVGVKWGTRLIDSLLAGTQNQGDLLIPRSKLNPLCNILNCSLTDFTLPSLTWERMFSEFVAVLWLIYHRF